MHWWSLVDVPRWCFGKLQTDTLLPSAINISSTITRLHLKTSYVQCMRLGSITLGVALHGSQESFVEGGKGRSRGIDYRLAGREQDGKWYLSGRVLGNHKIVVEYAHSFELSYYSPPMGSRSDQLWTWRGEFIGYGRLWGFHWYPLR